MMHRVINNTDSAAIALQAAAEARRAQSANTPAATTQTSSAQYNFAELFGAASDERGAVAATTVEPATTSTDSATAPFRDAIATATAHVTDVEPDVDVALGRATGNPSAVTDDPVATTAAQTAATTTAAESTEAAATTAAVATTPAANTTSGTGVEALVSAIMSGNLQATYVTNPSQLQETTPWSTDTMPNFYYASNQTAQQIASLLGGTVVQAAPFGQDQGWTEPMANFIQLPNGQTFNAADLAYYANSPNNGSQQLTADITQTINIGSDWTNYYKNGGAMPIFPEGYVGPPISGMTYPAGMIGADGNVINPAMQSSATQGT